MKKVFLLLIVAGFGASLFAQKPDSTRVKVGKKNIVSVKETDDNVEVRVFDDDFVVVDVDEKDDTVKLKLGNKGISIVETDEGTHVEIIDVDDFPKHDWKQRKKKFKGHWAGYEIGHNNFVDRNFTLAGSIPTTNFLDVNAGKSWNANINIMQYNIPMSRNIGWVTGMGFEWNNYNFNGNNVIGKDALTGRIVPVYLPAGITYTKNKMNTTYLTVPLMLEFQFGPKQKGFVSLGVIGGLNLHSNIQQQYTDGGSKEKSKIKNDLNLSPFRAAGTFRIGYKFVKLFTNVGLVPVFKENLGPAGAPDIYPVTIGLMLFNFR